MTIERHCHAGIRQTIRDAAIANIYAVRRALWLAQELLCVHAGFADSMGGLQPGHFWAAPKRYRPFLQLKDDSSSALQLSPFKALIGVPKTCR
ncbi:MAG: hypothetical protein B7Y43_03635 [Sphingomonas sp. 28-62-20]|nr:MAG: hypothetical protein B7Y43_03635 [Sphingomonas sp. 28-62-20]